jgi:hypothetical protein
MNERIEHITKQVDEYFDDLTIEFSRQAWMEKFAELIVEEVYDYILNATFNDEPWPDRAEVKKHFGVEE